MRKAASPPDPFPDENTPCRFLQGVWFWWGDDHTSSGPSGHLLRGSPLDSRPGEIAKFLICQFQLRSNKLCHRQSFLAALKEKPWGGGRSLASLVQREVVRSTGGIASSFPGNNPPVNPSGCQPPLHKGAFGARALGWGVIPWWIRVLRQRRSPFSWAYRPRRSAGPAGR